jgi:hypothetical protein
VPSPVSRIPSQWTASLNKDRAKGSVLISEQHTFYPAGIPRSTKTELEAQCYSRPRLSRPLRSGVNEDLARKLGVCAPQDVVYDIHNYAQRGPSQVDSVSGQFSSTRTSNVPTAQRRPSREARCSLLRTEHSSRSRCSGQVKAGNHPRCLVGARIFKFSRINGVSGHQSPKLAKASFDSLPLFRY